MRNLVDETPFDPLSGRPLFTTRLVGADAVRGREILDVGCGFGWFVHHCLEGGAARVAAIESADEQIAVVRRHLPDCRLNVVSGSALTLPFPDASFDVVVSWEVLEHLPKGSEGQFFAEVARVLRPGGSLTLSTPHWSLAANLLDPAWLLTGHRHYRPGDVEAFGAGVGLVPDWSLVRGGWWELLGMINLYVAKWIFRRRPFMADYFRRKTDAEYARNGGFATLFARFVKAPDSCAA